MPPRKKKKSGEGAVGLKPRLTYLMCDGYSIVCVHKECALFALMRLPKKAKAKHFEAKAKFEQAGWRLLGRMAGRSWNH
jgi:hypothetical protein